MILLKYFVFGFNSEKLTNLSKIGRKVNFMVFVISEFLIYIRTDGGSLLDGGLYF